MTAQIKAAHKAPTEVNAAALLSPRRSEPAFEIPREKEKEKEGRRGVRKRAVNCKSKLNMLSNITHTTRDLPSFMTHVR